MMPTRHKTHKRKGAMLLPVPRSIYKYLSQLRSTWAPEPVFPDRTPLQAIVIVYRHVSLPEPPPRSRRSSRRRSASTRDNGKGPNPSLLRSIFTTWLYGLKIRHGRQPFCRRSSRVRPSGRRTRSRWRARCTTRSWCISRRSLLNCCCFARRTATGTPTIDLFRLTASRKRKRGRCPLELVLIPVGNAAAGKRRWRVSRRQAPMRWKSR